MSGVDVFYNLRDINLIEVRVLCKNDKQETEVPVRIIPENLLQSF